MLHPACTVLASEHAVVSLWAAHQGQGRIEDLELGRAEATLVLRDGDEVQVLPVSTAIARFLAALAAGTALGLLVMTAVIQLLVYPGAYPTHGVWAAVLLYLMARGPARVSLDQLIGRRWK